MAEKASRDAPLNCAVLPQRKFTTNPREMEGIGAQTLPRSEFLCYNKSDLNLREVCVWNSGLRSAATSI